MEGEGADEHRHRCLVRYVLAMRVENRDKAHLWLHGRDDKNGKYQAGWNELHPQSRLEKDVKSQWALGNRGAYGCWK